MTHLPDDFVEQWHEWTKFRDSMVHARDVNIDNAITSAIDGLKIVESLIRLRSQNPEDVRFNPPEELGSN